MDNTVLGVGIPFVEHLGFTLERFQDGTSEMRHTARPEHLNNFGMTHGGVCMSLLDVTMAAAARSLQQGSGVVTVEMKTTFLQPAHGPLVSRGRVLHRTGGMAFAEGTIFDPEGRPCAHATGTFKYLARPRPGAAPGAAPEPTAAGQPVAG